MVVEQGPYDVEEDEGNDVVGEEENVVVDLECLDFVLVLVLVFVFEERVDVVVLCEDVLIDVVALLEVSVMREDVDERVDEVVVCNELEVVVLAVTAANTVQRIHANAVNRC